MTRIDTIEELASELVRKLSAAGRTVATAESCTGGGIAQALTAVAGSSACFGYGIVSYSNPAKQSLLGVRAETLQEHGAVSEAVVREMAGGALGLSGADFSVAVSGVAGPGGGSAEKPVGTVWFAWARRAGGDREIDAAVYHLDGDRAAIRAASVRLALEGLLARLARG
jgi:nicotinamide-nucleotide amidase